MPQQTAQTYCHDNQTNNILPSRTAAQISCLLSQHTPAQTYRPDFLPNIPAKRYGRTDLLPGHTAAHTYYCFHTAGKTNCLRPRQSLKPTVFRNDTRLVSHPIPTSESDVLSSATTVSHTYCLLQRHATRVPSYPNERVRPTVLSLIHI